MEESLPLDLESLSLTDIIRLQNKLSSVVVRRFEQSLTLVFSDIVRSTAYFARYGDEAGRRLQQQHLDLLTEAITSMEGRIVDVAGDGALLAFPQTVAAIDTLIGFHQHLRRRNHRLPPEQQWTTRAGVHWGAVLTDGSMVAGDAVNLCAKLTGTASPGEIRLTMQAFHELPSSYRMACRALQPIHLAGSSQPIEALELLWQETLCLPTAVVVQETGDRITLPQQQVISFGRLRDINGVRANDVVLQLADPQLTLQISRWHFELGQEPDRLFLRSLSDKTTEVDGKVLVKGQQAPIAMGSVARLAGVLTLQFVSATDPSSSSATTLSSQVPAS